MERTQLFDLMGELKLYGMKAAYDEIMATAVKRQHEPQRIVGDLLNAEVSEKQARSIKYQLTIAKLPLAKDLNDFHFEGNLITQSLEQGLVLIEAGDEVDYVYPPELAVGMFDDEEPKPGTLGESRSRTAAMPRLAASIHAERPAEILDKGRAACRGDAPAQCLEKLIRLCVDRCYRDNRPS